MENRFEAITEFISQFPTDYTGNRKAHQRRIEQGGRQGWQGIDPYNIFGINPQRIGLGDEEAINTKDLLESIFGPKTTFQELQIEAIKLSDSFAGTK